MAWYHYEVSTGKGLCFDVPTCGAIATRTKDGALVSNQNESIKLLGGLIGTLWPKIELNLVMRRLRTFGSASLTATTRIDPFRI